MKFFRIGTAIILTLVLLYIARNTSRGRPEELQCSIDGIQIEYTTVPKVVEGDTAHIDIEVTGDLPDDAFVAFRKAKPRHSKPLQRLDDYMVVRMRPSDTAENAYYAEVPAGEKGGRTYYYFQIRQNQKVLAEWIPDGKPFVLKFIGEVPSAVLIGHIILMFATVFCVVMSAIRAVPLMQGEGEVRDMARCMFMAVVFAFLGGYPFGWAMNWYAFGVIWEGVPFGTDATDNKTQLLFLYLVFIVLSSVGSLTRGRFGRDLFSKRTLGRLGVGALFLLLVIYLIPHSIQFSPGLTYAVCYSFIGLLVLIYLIALFRARRHG
jgi:hypothetical protein